MRVMVYAVMVVALVMHWIQWSVAAGELLVGFIFSVVLFELCYAFFRWLFGPIGISASGTIERRD